MTDPGVGEHEAPDDASGEPAAPAGDALRVALIHEVFFDDSDSSKLVEHLERALSLGADAALLPELPLNGWAPATKVSHDEDAEPVDGPRQRRMAEAARTVGIALVGGAIVCDGDGRRRNTAVVYGADGAVLGRYDKVHLPEEEGYWETSHYVAGDEPPVLVPGLPLRVGLQICSDVNRPEGIQLLAAQGVEVVLAPRATPSETYERWRLVLRANAVTSGAYVLSANRPRPEGGASIGGPSIAIAPTGEVLAESEEPVTVVALSRATVEEATRTYPGYLKRFPELYARGWGALEE